MKCPITVPLCAVPRDELRDLPLARPSDRRLAFPLIRLARTIGLVGRQAATLFSVTDRQQPAATADQRLSSQMNPIAFGSFNSVRAAAAGGFSGTRLARAEAIPAVRGRQSRQVKEPAAQR